MKDPIISRLESIEKLLVAAESPRLSEEQACKFLKVGRPKLKVLYIEKKIQKYVDQWGEKYYLKNDLIEYLKNNQAEKLLRRKG